MLPISSIINFISTIHADRQAFDVLCFTFLVPSVVDIGDCLIGGTKVCKFLVKNEGGDGKFCFLPKEKWPVTNFKVQ